MGSTVGKTPTEAPTPYGCNSSRLGTTLDINATSRRVHEFSTPARDYSSTTRKARAARHYAAKAGMSGNTAEWHGMKGEWDSEVRLGKATPM